MRALAVTGLALAASVRAAPFIANVTDYGAIGDGVTLATAALEAAISAVHSHGGGELLFPSGTYLTAPLNLTSNCTVRLLNATLLAAADWAAWTVVAPLPSYGRGRDFPGPRYCAFLGMNNLSAVTIVGEGGADANFINGQGASWWAGVRNGTLRVTPGHLLETMWSSDIEIAGVTLVDSPFWNTHLWSSKRLWVHDVKVRAPPTSANTDGFDPDSSSDVVIERVDVQNGDDCIAVKSGWDGPGVAYGTPTTNVTFRDAVCDSRAQAGNCVAIGSEMSGGVADIFITNITCINSGTLIDVKSTLGRGGYVRNVHLSNSTITGKLKVGLQVADNYGDNNGPVNKTLVPTMGDIFITNVTAKSTAVIAASGYFEGLGDTAVSGKVTNVVLQDIDLGAPTNGWHCVNVSGTSTRVSPEPCPALRGGV